MRYPGSRARKRAISKLLRAASAIYDDRLRRMAAAAREPWIVPLRRVRLAVPQDMLKSD